MRAVAVRDEDVLEPVPAFPVPAIPYYWPWQGGGVGYSVLVLGRVVAELWRGDAAWWLVTNNRIYRHETMREATSRVARACERMGDL